MNDTLHQVNFKTAKVKEVKEISERISKVLSEKMQMRMKIKKTVGFKDDRDVWMFKIKDKIHQRVRDMMKEATLSPIQLSPQNTFSNPATPELQKKRKSRGKVSKNRIPDLIRKHFFKKKSKKVDIIFLTRVVNMQNKMEKMFTDVMIMGKLFEG